MCLDDRAADRQSHAHTIGLGRVECVEEPVQALRLQSRAPIPHSDAHAVRSVLLSADQQLARPLVRSAHRFDGVEDQVEHHLLKLDPISPNKRQAVEARRANCAPLAGKSHLNRLELSRPEPARYHKISYDAAAIEGLFVELFLDAHSTPPPQITLDLDATDDPLHGHQEDRFFHGYYDTYCYLPLYVFCGRHLLASKLRPANLDASAGSVEEAARIIAQIRRRWPKVRVLLRADFGLCPRGADGVVRGQRRRFPVRPGQEPAPQRRDRDRTRRGARAEPKHWPAGATLP